MKLVVLLTALILTLPLKPTTASAEPAALRPLMVRTYNNFGVPIRQLNIARKTADAILRDAGVEPSWRDCRTYRGPSASSTDACVDRLRPAEVIVRIVEAPTRVNPHSFGYSHVDMQARSGLLSTVFADRIQIVSARVRVDAGTLLGRTFAHELGHLLLGTASHSAEGLMRARWPDSVLEHSFNQDWLFSRREAAQMWQTLVARLSD